MRGHNDDLMMDFDEELTNALFQPDLPQQPVSAPVAEQQPAPSQAPAPATNDNEDYSTVPGQLAVDVYETPEQLIIKARTAGVNRNDLDVSISDGVLTISGTLSSGDETEATHWHVQECYWGEFSRTLVLPVAVKEDEVKAILKDGVLTVMFNKVKQEQARKIQIQ